MYHPRIREIYQETERTLTIVWTDSIKNSFDVVELRRSCPCASCIDEFTGKKMLDPKLVSEHIRPNAIHSIGRYALGIHFSDGHRTGIYTFQKLREFQKDKAKESQ